MSWEDLIFMSKSTFTPIIPRTDCIYSTSCEWKLWVEESRFPRSFEHKTANSVNGFITMYRWDTWNVANRSKGFTQSLVLCIQHHEIVLKKWGDDEALVVREMEATDDYYTQLAERERISREVLDRCTGRYETRGNRSYRPSVAKDS